MSKSHQSDWQPKNLRNFLVVAEELHFHRAAERLNIAQSALSRHIQQLEVAVGTPLLHRTNRRVILTEAGHVFYQEVKEILHRLERAVQLTQRVAKGELGELAVTFTGPAMSTVLPKILQTFKQTFPDIKINLKELPTTTQLAVLEQGEVDCGFFHLTSRPAGIVVRTILEERLGIVLCRSHRLAKLRKLKLNDLQSEPFILFPRTLNPTLYDQIMTVCKQVGFYPHIVEEISPRQNAISLVAAGMGITTLPPSLRWLCSPKVVYKNLTGLAPRLELTYGWRENNTSVPLSHFLKVVESELTQLRVASENQ